MNGLRDRRGFSLVELIITMAIMAILATVTVGAIGYINTGKTKKASAKLNSKLTYIQTETMTKEGRSYLYIYKTNDGVYYVVSNKDASGNIGNVGLLGVSELSSYLSSNPSASKKICDGSVTVTGTTASGQVVEMVELTDTAGANQVNLLKIGYDKATGAFSDSCGYAGSSETTDFYHEIKLAGKQTSSIKLVEKTGKHYID